MSYVGPIGAEIFSSIIKKTDKSSNFYPFVTKLGTQVGIVRLNFKSKFELCGSNRIFNFSNIDENHIIHFLDLTVVFS